MQEDIGPQDPSKNNFTHNYMNIDLKNQETNVGRIVKNVHNILRHLERSIKKSLHYEKQIISTTSSTCHSHSPTEDAGYHTEPAFNRSYHTESAFEDNDTPMNNACRPEVNPTDSWSTMSIVCLQYQYDELTRKYQNLLKVHDERCKDVASRESLLVDCRVEMIDILEELEDAQKTVHKVCSKYIAMKKRKDRDKGQYEQKISVLEETSTSLLSLLMRSREEVDDLLRNKMAEEHESGKALLLAEIRRSNQLFQENLQLKARIQELAPGTVEWQTTHW